MGLLTNQTVLITGSGSGLGKAAAITFAKEGANVVLCGRKQDKLDAVLEIITSQGGKAIAVKADVSEEAQVEQLVQQSIQSFGSVDILINNAAVLETGSILETTLEAWNVHLQNNLTSVFLMTKACLPWMQEHKRGVIINITSALSYNGAGGYAAYSASKAAVESFTRTTADEAKDHHIYAVTFDPGTVKSDMHATGRDPMEVAPEIVKLAASV